MTSLPFHQVDVFTTKSYKGNPVAVVIAMDSAVSISDEMMAAFANWTNLSETTFVLPPTNAQQADYRLRIFTTTKELPFAGHPTIGSCQAFLAAGHKPRKAGTVVQECGLGLIELRVEADGAIYFTAPALRRSGKVDPATVAIACNAMSIDPSNVLNAEWIITGPHWFALQLKNAQAVLDVQCKKLEADDEDISGVSGESILKEKDPMVPRSK